MDTLSVADGRGRRALAVSTLFFFFSFVGWAWEKLWFFIALGKNADRGFLFLPLCTVYGSALVLIRLLLRFPAVDRRYPVNLLAFLGYAAAAALIATAAELATGLLFEYAFGARLWSYRGAPYEFCGYICLPVSVAWGLLIATVMAAVWRPLENLLVRVPSAFLGTANALLWLAVALDFCLQAAAHF